MKIDLIKQVSIIICFSILVFSCSKSKDKVPPTEDEMSIELASQKVFTDALYDDVSMELILVSIENNLANQPSSPLTSCAIITITPKDPNVWPKTITLDYGAGCRGYNDYFRKGKIIFTLNQKLLTPGAVMSVSFDNYTVNGYKLEGNYIITMNDLSDGLKFSVQLTNGKVTYPNGDWYTKTTNTTWVQTAGYLTTNFSDDEYNVTGNGTITSSENKVLSATSKTSLLRKFACTNTVSGILDLTYNNINGVLDFGNGECDKVAVITVAGKSYNITLP